MSIELDIFVTLCSLLVFTIFGLLIFTWGWHNGKSSSTENALQNQLKGLQDIVQNNTAIVNQLYLFLKSFNIEPETKKE